MPSDPKRATIAQALLLVSCISCSPPSEYTPPSRSLEWIERYGYAIGDVEDFSFGDQGMWIPVVRARIDGETVQLIFDTGTHGYATLDEPAMRQLDLPIEGWTTFRDASGEPAGRIPLARVSTLEFASLRLTDIEITGLGPESIVGQRRGFVGTLGWEALAGHRFTIDYSNGKVAIASSPLPADISDCATRYVAPFISPPELDGLILIEASLDGRDLLAQLDTGKSKTVLDPGIASIRSFETGDRGIEIGGLRIGPFELKTRFGRMGRGFDSFSEGVDRPVLVGLGSDVLSRFLLTVDYSTRRIVLEQAACTGTFSQPAVWGHYSISSKRKDVPRPREGKRPRPGFGGR